MCNPVSKILGMSKRDVYSKNMVQNIEVKDAVNRYLAGAKLRKWAVSTVERDEQNRPMKLVAYRDTDGFTAEYDRRTKKVKQRGYEYA